MQAILPMMMTKLYSTDVTQMIMKAAYDLLGADGLVEPALGGNYARENFAAGIVQNYLFSLGPAIAGGASNIQRNIIGERGLGLPRDPRPPSWPQDRRAFRSEIWFPSQAESQKFSLASRSRSWVSIMTSIASVSSPSERTVSSR